MKAVGLKWSKKIHPNRLIVRSGENNNGGNIFVLENHNPPL